MALDAGLLSICPKKRKVGRREVPGALGGEQAGGVGLGALPRVDMSGNKASGIRPAALPTSTFSPAARAQGEGGERTDVALFPGRPRARLLPAPPSLVHAATLPSGPQSAPRSPLAHAGGSD